MPEVNVHYADGDWHAMTLGNVIQLMVDAGLDVAATMRTIEDGEPDERGQFVRHMEIKLIPNGVVVDEIEGCKTISKILKAMIEEGLVW